MALHCFDPIIQRRSEIKGCGEVVNSNEIITVVMVVLAIIIIWRLVKVFGSELDEFKKENDSAKK